MSEALAGVGTLIRSALRRERWTLPLWLGGFAAMAASSAAATRDLYPTEASRRAAAQTINATATLVAMYGPVYDPTSLGALSLIKLTAFGSTLVAVLMIFVVVRLTRQDEESGRLELIAAGCVGRAAPLAAALIVALGSSVALGLATALGLMSARLPPPGCVVFGASWALTALTFSSIAAVVAQWTASSRAARGFALAAVGAAYALRAVGDLAERGPGWASWLSPIGWSQQLRPFAGNRAWVAVIPVAVSAVLVPLAFFFRSRRDLGAGLLRERPGPAHGRLGSVLALAWRLHQGMFLAWWLGVVAMAFVLGSVAHNVSGLLSSPQIRRFFAALGGERGLMDAFLTAEVGIMGSLISAYGIAVTQRLRSEEAGGQVELLLSNAVTRRAWIASHTVVAFVGLAALNLSSGAAIGLGHGISMGAISQVGRVTLASAGQIPAAWVVAALGVTLFGVAPRASGFVWGLLAIFIALGEFGQLWRLPTWALDLSPFAHTPRMPAAPARVAPLVGLTLTALVLVGTGWLAWGRRDVEP